MGCKPIVGSSHRFLIYGLIPLEPVDPVECFFRPSLTSIDPGVEQVSLLYEHLKQLKIRGRNLIVEGKRVDACEMERLTGLFGAKEVTKPYKPNKQLAS